MGSSEMKLGAVLVPEDRHPQVSILGLVTVILLAFRVRGANTCNNFCNILALILLPIDFPTLFHSLVSLRCASCTFFVINF